VAAASVRQGAVALAPPRAEVAVQRRAVEAALRAEAVVALPLRGKAAMVESQWRAVEAALRAEAVVALPLHAEAE
jgi:hypothetical protein